MSIEEIDTNALRNSLNLVNNSIDRRRSDEVLTGTYGITYFQGKSKQLFCEKLTKLNKGLYQQLFNKIAYYDNYVNYIDKYKALFFENANYENQIREYFRLIAISTDEIYINQLKANMTILSNKVASNQVEMNKIKAKLQNM